MSPRPVDKQQKSKKIARAALKLFSQKGYAATSVSQIAKTAEIGKGTFYDYFETKEDIFVAAILEWMVQFEVQYSKLLEDIEDPIRRLKALGDLCNRWVDPINPATMRLSLEILQQSLMKGGVIFKRRHIAREMHSGLRRMVNDILLDGISKGVFRPEIARDTEKITTNLLAYLDGICLHSMVSDHFFDLKGQIELYIQNLIGVIAVEPGRDDNN